MNEIITIITEAIMRNSKGMRPCSMKLNAIASRKGMYIYLKGDMPLEMNEINAIRTVCDNQSLLLVECNQSGASIIAEP